MADEETPPAGDEPPPPAAAPPAPPAPPADPPADSGLGEIRDTVTQLVASVAALTDLVGKAVRPDENPVHGIPWTHRGGTGHREET